MARRATSWRRSFDPHHVLVVCIRIKMDAFHKTCHGGNFWPITWWWWNPSFLRIPLWSKLWSLFAPLLFFDLEDKLERRHGDGDLWHFPFASWFGFCPPIPWTKHANATSLAVDSFNCIATYLQLLQNTTGYFKIDPKNLGLKSSSPNVSETFDHQVRPPPNSDLKEIWRSKMIQKFQLFQERKRTTTY